MYKVLMFLNSGFVDRYAFLKTVSDISVWDAIKSRYMLIQLSVIDGKFGDLENQVTN